MAPKKQQTSSEKRETVASVAEDINTLVLTALREEIRRLVGGKKKPRGKYTVAETVAHLGQRASQVAAEQRKAAAEERKRLGAITPAMVLAWFRTIPTDERRQLVREIQELDARGSGLA